MFLSYIGVKWSAFLMFLFLALYLPTGFLHLFKEQNTEEDFKIYEEVARFLRVLNSFVNAYVHAGQRKSNKIVYKHMLTHWPWNWTEVTFTLNILESRNLRKATLIQHVSFGKQILGNHVSMYSKSTPPERWKSL